MFAPGEPFQARLMFIGDPRSLPKSGAPEPGLTREHKTRLEGLLGTNTIAYYVNYGRKKFNCTGPWDLIYNNSFSLKLENGPN